MPCVYLPGPAPAVTVANSTTGHLSIGTVDILFFLVKATSLALLADF